MNFLKEKATSDGAANQLKDETNSSPEVNTDEETRPEDDRIVVEPDVSTYRHESRERYVEDLDQQMAVLPDIVTPTAEVTTYDNQVGDMDTPLTGDLEQSRQLVWRNKHIIIVKGAPSLQPHEGIYAI